MLEGHEATVIGYLINCPTATGDIGHELSLELFAFEKHRFIVEAAGNLALKGTSINQLSICDELEAMGKLTAIGGRVEVVRIAVEFGSVTRTSADYALDELRAAAARRGTAAICQRAAIGDINPEEAIEELKRLARGSQGASRLTIRSAAEIISMTLDEHDCLMGDRLLAKGQPLVIAGQGSIGKSRLLLQLAAACITGRKWGCFETHARDTRWLILQTENSNRRLQKDLLSLKAWCGGDWPKVESNLLIHTLEGDQDGILTLSSARVTRDLHAVIQQAQPDIIALDPLKDVMIGDPNNDADMQTTASAISALCKNGNRERAIIVLHHALTGRAGAAKALGYERSGFGRNSKVLQSWTRAQINIAPGSSENNESLVLTCGKNSNGQEFEPFAVRLNPASMIYDVDEAFNLEEWRAEISGPTRSKKRVFHTGAVRDALDGKEMTKPALVHAITEETGCGRSRAYELIDEAVTAKQIKLSRATKTYALVQ